MGSVPHLYTTGDNDPEIYPVQYYRHYLYCDRCGSFELEYWEVPKKWRWFGLGSEMETAGMRCTRCDATYAFGTPFFNDLSANPLNLTLDEVPRPLGVSFFEVGEYVGELPR